MHSQFPSVPQEDRQLLLEHALEKVLYSRIMKRDDGRRRKTIVSAVEMEHRQQQQHPHQNIKYNEESTGHSAEKDEGTLTSSDFAFDGIDLDNDHDELTSSQSDFSDFFY